MLATKIIASASAAFFVVLSVAGCSADAADTPRTITIDDTAEILNADKLNDVLGELEFREPTDIAIYTRFGEYSDNINRETLDYAREVHPEWISDDTADYGDYWSDGLFIITLSVEVDGHGQIGTYFGEDRTVSESRMETMHAAGTDNFRRARWTDGIIDVATSGSELIGAPPVAPWVWTLLGFGAAGMGGLTVLGVTVTRQNRREEFARALEAGSAHLTRVAMDLDRTELAATTFPAGSRYAAKLEKQFADFLVLYRESDAERDALRALTKKERGTQPAVTRAKNYRDAARRLDSIDDAIDAASSLYRRSPEWKSAWALQTKPLRDDIDAIGSFISSDDIGVAAIALRSYAAQASDRLSEIDADFATERLGVDDALDALRELREELTDKLEAYADAQIAAYAEDEEERKQMRASFDSSRGATNVYGSGSILDLTYGHSYFWHVADYSAGYRAGTVAIDNSRASSSTSSGISAGYGGGTSFSGSGGSSRF